MLELLLNLLAIDSTSNHERALVAYLEANLTLHGAQLVTQEVSSQRHNLFLKWGHPKIIFCTHLDTVAPYVAPSVVGEVISGRGACDAKGQLVALYEACSQLAQEGWRDFGLLLVVGEESDSVGAKVANELIAGCEYVIIGEPTENHLISAAKGNVLATVTLLGQAAHSGYPQHGRDAVREFAALVTNLAQFEWPLDPLLGTTTYNFGALQAPNPPNVVPDRVDVKLFFRTTFASHQLVLQRLPALTTQTTAVTIQSSSLPMQFEVVPGFPTATVAFGSDAPHLTKLGKPLLYGAGTILKAHTMTESITKPELELAVRDFKQLFYQLRAKQE